MSKRTYSAAFPSADASALPKRGLCASTEAVYCDNEERTRSEMLVSLAETLLPSCSNGDIKMYEALTRDLDNVDRTRRTQLSRIKFSYRQSRRSARVLGVCSLTLVPPGKLVFACRIRSNSKWQITLDADLDRFEERYEREARAAPGAYRAIIGTTPAWCYVLLSMLVYTDQVFCDPALEHRIRLQHAYRTGPAYAILKEFWDVKPEGELYPFLVRLMRPEFALRLDPSRFHQVFHDGWPQLRITM